MLFRRSPLAMSVRFFVTSSALMILSWLAVTFFLVVPMETYPTQGFTDEGDGSGKVQSALAAEDPAALARVSR